MRRAVFGLVTALSVTGGAPKPFVGKGVGSSFCFTPDGASLSFLRDVDGDAQVHLIGLNGGEARAVTCHEGGVDSFRWSRRGGRLFFVAKERRGDAAHRWPRWHESSSSENQLVLFGTNAAEGGW